MKGDFEYVEEIPQSQYPLDYLEPPKMVWVRTLAGTLIALELSEREGDPRSCFFQESVLTYR